MPIEFDVIVVGAGAAGMMCAATAGQRGLRVLVLEQGNKVGKKILMSGGGRCNFTNLNVTPENYLSHNRHFCKSALSRYTQWDFIALVERYRIAYHEKTLGQLFCNEKAHLIVDMLLAECQKGGVKIALNQKIQSVKQSDNNFAITTLQQKYSAKSLVIASGGLSIPSMGSSAFGYELAKQFGLKVYPTRAGLVPYTLHEHDKRRFADLAGVSIEASVQCNGQSFKEQLLFTHRGVSGPVILQISSYWHPGDVVEICLLPALDIVNLLQQARIKNPEQQLKTVLSQYAAKRLLEVFIPPELLAKPIKRLTERDIESMISTLQRWELKPNATEGYRTAEVTLGGVDCDAVSSKTFESKQVKGLHFIGEVLDVTGWLGGYNFQWAWASGHACGEAL